MGRGMSWEVEASCPNERCSEYRKPIIVKLTLLEGTGAEDGKFDGDDTCPKCGYYMYCPRRLVRQI